MTSRWFISSRRSISVKPTKIQNQTDRFQLLVWEGTKVSRTLSSHLRATKDYLNYQIILLILSLKVWSCSGDFDHIRTSADVCETSFQYLMQHGREVERAQKRFGHQQFGSVYWWRSGDTIKTEQLLMSSVFRSAVWNRFLSFNNERRSSHFRRLNGEYLTDCQTVICWLIRSNLISSSSFSAEGFYPNRLSIRIFGKHNLKWSHPARYF